MQIVNYSGPSDNRDATKSSSDNNHDITQYLKPSAPPRARGQSSYSVMRSHSAATPLPVNNPKRSSYDSGLGDKNGSRMAIASPALLAARVKDSQQWVLRVYRPELGESSNRAERTPATSSPHRSEATTPTNGVVPSTMPLESRVTLLELQCIMELFATGSASVIDAQGSASKAKPSETFNEVHVSSPRLASPPGTLGQSSYHSSDRNDDETHHLLAPAGTRKTAAAAGLNYAAEQLQSMDSQSRPGHVASSSIYSLTADGKDASPLTNNENNTNVMNVSSAASHGRIVNHPPLPSIANDFSNTRCNPVGEPSPSALSNPLVGPSRRITQAEFVSVLRRIVPSATEAEVLELLNKIDYEGSGSISWNDFTTFLVTQTQHQTEFANVSTQLEDIPEPEQCASHHLHQMITCCTVDPQRRLIVTGGSEGSVQAWGMYPLTHRGLLFAGKGWIVGLHFSTKSRVLYVITMDRHVFVLSCTSFEVLRVYRGRPVRHSQSGIKYARESIPVVTIGGIAASVAPKSVLARRKDGVTRARRIEQQRSQNMEQLKRSSDAAHDGISSSGGSGGGVITTTRAYEALHVDDEPLTNEGTAPYIAQDVEEWVLSGLVDAVSATCYHFTQLEEDMLLLGTVAGDVYLFDLSTTSQQKLLPPHRVLHLHTDRITRLTLYADLVALATCADDREVKLTSMITGELLRGFQSRGPGQHSAVHDFDYHPHLKLFVTVGSERHGLVWELNQSQPIAVLEAHNSPCQCCAFVGDLVVTAALDGSLNTYHAQGFALQQTISLDRFHAPRHIVTADDQQSLLCFARYPFFLQAKRRAALECPANYTGHLAPILTVLYTSEFDVVITVDTEGTVMTWDRSTGANVFAFRLKNFSDSAMMNSARLTCVVLDGLQRRLLTGFHNGAVVVWNVVNGQAIAFITAAVAEEASGRPTSFRRKAQSQKERRRIRADGRYAPGPPAAGGGGATDASVAAPAQLKCEAELGRLETKGAMHSRAVTALGSLIRHGATVLLVAVGRHLYMVPDSVDLTIASAPFFVIPAAYGEVLVLCQVSPQVMACGTSSGAIFFLHVLSGSQEGSVLWVSESAITLHDPMRDFAFDETCWSRKRSTASPGGGVAHGARRRSLSRTGRQASTSALPTHARAVTARVVKLHVLSAPHDHLLLSVHLDGTVALWHVTRRLFLGAVSVTSAGVDDGPDGAGSVVVDVDETHRWLAFADAGGNVHVCRVELGLLASSEAEQRATLLSNPALYFPFASRQPSPTPVECRSTHPEASPGASLDRPATRADEHVLSTFKTFKRVGVFGTGLSAISSLRVLRGPTRHALRRADVSIAEEFSQCDDGCSHNSSSSLNDTTEDPIIVSAGRDKYTRVFTAAGCVIGEFGMDPWAIENPSTYRLLSETTRTFPATQVKLQSDVNFDYLEELAQVALTCRSPTGLPPPPHVRGYSLRMGGPLAPSRPSTASKFRRTLLPPENSPGIEVPFSEPSPLVKVDDRSHEAGAAAARTRASQQTAKETAVAGGSPSSPEHQSASIFRYYSSVTPAGRGAGQGQSNTTGSLSKPGDRRRSRGVDPRDLHYVSTRMTRSARLLHQSSQRFRGILKHDFADYVLRPRCATPSRDGESFQRSDEEPRKRRADRRRSVSITEFLEDNEHDLDAVAAATPTGRRPPRARSPRAASLLPPSPVALVKFNEDSPLTRSRSAEVYTDQYANGRASPMPTEPHPIGACRQRRRSSVESSPKAHLQQLTASRPQSTPSKPRVQIASLSSRRSSAAQRPPLLTRARAAPSLVVSLQPATAAAANASRRKVQEKKCLVSSACGELTGSPRLKGSVSYLSKSPRASTRPPLRSSPVDAATLSDLFRRHLVHQDEQPQPFAGGRCTSAGVDGQPRGEAKIMMRRPHTADSGEKARAGESPSIKTAVDAILQRRSTRRRSTAAFGGDFVPLRISSRLQVAPMGDVRMFSPKFFRVADVTR